jgi:adenylate cyclase
MQEIPMWWNRPVRSFGQESLEKRGLAREGGGKRQEAHKMLSAVYGWFSEGFDTSGLREAKALLEALA